MAGVAIALFYSHIVPFLLLAVTYTALVPWRRLRAWQIAAPWLPSVPITARWAAFTDSGRVSTRVLLDLTGGTHKAFLPSVADFYRQVGDVFTDASDGRVFLAMAVVVLVAVLLAAAEHRPPRAYAILPVTCLIGYFVLAEGHDYVFFIAQRFAVLALMTAIPLLPMPSGRKGAAVARAAGIVGLIAIGNTARHFWQFEHDEVGNFDSVIAVMAENRRVCTLVYDPSSGVVRNAPFLHFGSYYQVQKGGVVMFTYAGYPHWPIDFAPGRYPPPGGPARQRWEWTPHRVALDEIYPYYDYVLTRGDGFSPAPGTYREEWHANRWTLWARW